MTALVYVVDDDPLVTESLGTALRLETPYQIRTFLSGAAALDALSSEPPDVVISDFKMPGMDGVQFLKTVRDQLSDAVLLLLTGYSDKDSAIAAVNDAGIYAYVEKPWELHELLHRLQTGLERQELTRQLRTANTELARQNEALRVAQERLVASERLAAVGRVVSGIAHEIGNQLALVGYAEAIKVRAGGGEIAELADVIVHAQKRLAAMVAEVRDFTRAPDEPAGRVELEPSDVVSVVDEALALLRYDREVGRCRLVQVVRRRPLARLHRGKFTQVVLNLVRNAAQASAPNAEIEVVLDQEEAGAVILIVADYGIGMTAEVMARLGEPFFTTRGERGSGLGLGISQRIVAEHGGRMSFDSKPGAGTRVTVILPGLEPRS